MAIKRIVNIGLLFSVAIFFVTLFALKMPQDSVTNHVANWFTDPASWVWFKMFVAMHNSPLVPRAFVRLGELPFLMGYCLIIGLVCGWLFCAVEPQAKQFWNHSLLCKRIRDFPMIAKLCWGWCLFAAIGGLLAFMAAHLAERDPLLRTWVDASFIGSIFAVLGFVGYGFWLRIKGEIKGDIFFVHIVLPQVLTIGMVVLRMVLLK